LFSRFGAGSHRIWFSSLLFPVSGCGYVLVCSAVSFLKKKQNQRCLVLGGSSKFGLYRNSPPPPPLYSGWPPPKSIRGSGECDYGVGGSRGDSDQVGMGEATITHTSSTHQGPPLPPPQAIRPTTQPRHATHPRRHARSPQRFSGSGLPSRVPLTRPTVLRRPVSPLPQLQDRGGGPGAQHPKQK
jgi:hypothetical protein